MEFIPLDKNQQDSEVLKQACRQLNLTVQLRPERLRNKVVSIGGFGSHIIERRPNREECNQRMIGFRLNQIQETKKFLVNIHRTLPDEQVMCQQTKLQSFARSYKDNEVDHEEEKKLKVARCRDSMPFGMNIRNAAHKAAYGTDGGSSMVLQRYVTNNFDKKKRSLTADSDGLDILSENSSESVSNDSSDLETELDLDLDDLDPSKPQNQTKAAAAGGKKEKKEKERKGNKNHRDSEEFKLPQRAARSGPVAYPIMGDPDLK